jgi:hypothetical protein
MVRIAISPGAFDAIVARLWRNRPFHVASNGERCRTCERLGISGEKQRQAVAKFIIRLAGEDNSLDAAALRTGRSWPWEVSHIPPPFPPARIPHRTPPLSEKKSPSAGER